MNWSFQIWLGAPSDSFEVWSDRLYSVCDDCTAGVTSGDAFADFDREADSLQVAIRSAVEDIHKASLTATRVEISNEEVAEWSS